MFLVYLALVFVAAGLGFRFRHWMKLKRADYTCIEGWQAGATILYVVAGILLFVTVLANLVEYSNQLVAAEEVKKVVKLERIFLNKADNLTKKFATYLSEQYPNHERDVFKSISPKEASFYLVKYPEIQSSQTMMALVDKIDELMEDYYEQQMEKERILREMRFRAKNPWLFYSLMPAIDLNVGD